MYEEVIKDINELKRSAQDSAVKTLVEALSPRISEFIEKQIVGSLDGSDFGGGDSLGDPFADENAKDEVDTEMSVDLSVDPLVSKNQPKDIVSDEGPVDVSLPAEDKEIDVYDMDDETIGILSSVQLNSELADEENEFGKRIRAVENKIRNFNKKNASLREISSTLIRVNDMYKYAKRNFPLQETYLKTLARNQRMLEELRTKMNKLDEDVTIKLSGLPEDLDLSDLGVSLESGEDEEVEDETSSDDLDLGDDSEDDGESGDGVPASDDSDDSGDDESDDEELNFESEDLSDDDIIEIDEASFKRELSRMVESKNVIRTASWPAGHGPGKVSSKFAEKTQDPFKVKLSAGRPSTSKVWGVPAKTQDPLKVKLSEVDDTPEGEELDECDANMEGEDHDMLEMDDMPHDLPESVQKSFRIQTQLQSEAKKRASNAKKYYEKALSEAKYYTGIANACKSKKDHAGYKRANDQVSKRKSAMKDLRESFTFFAKKHNEAVAQKKSLVESAKRSKNSSLNENKNLKQKLTETNLFNTKLMYTNKVLRNENFSKKVQADIIERLDEATSPREVKVIYESLVSTLTSAIKKEKIVESTGSSSRPSTSGSPSGMLTEGQAFEADRWAKLAGINKLFKRI